MDGAEALLRLDTLKGGDAVRDVLWLSLCRLNVWIVLVILGCTFNSLNVLPCPLLVAAVLRSVWRLF